MISRYWLAVLAIVWSGYSYGQQAEKQNAQVAAAQPAVVSATVSQSPGQAGVASLPVKTGQPPQAMVTQPVAPAVQPEQPTSTAAVPSAPSQPSAQEPAEAAVAAPVQVLEVQEEKKTEEAPKTEQITTAVAQPGVSTKMVQEGQQETQSTKEEQPIKTGTEDAQLQEEEVLPEVVGIDTVNVETASGNWLLKRIWFERAQEQYEKIKSLFDKVLELRFAIFAKRTELDRTLFDPFYMNIGIGQGELLEIINRLLHDLQDMRGKEGALSAEVNVLYEQVEQEKITLEQLQKDISGVTEIDAAVERAISQLIEQVNACRGYEKQAWETFKEIAKQLSDKKARELYYVMDTYRKNSANIVTYLQKDFTNYMQVLERTAHEQIDRIMTAVDELKKKNIDFKEQAKRLERKKLPQERVREPQEEQEEEEQGFLMRIWSLITGMAHSVWEVVSGAIHGVYTWIWPFEESEGNSDAVALKV